MSITFNLLALSVVGVVVFAIQKKLRRRKGACFPPAPPVNNRIEVDENTRLIIPDQLEVDELTRLIIPDQPEMDRAPSPMEVDEYVSRPSTPMEVDALQIAIPEQPVATDLLKLGIP